MIKVLLLALCALVVWWLTRPKNRRRNKTATREKLAHCPRCGVYHETGSDCSCEKKK